MKKRLERLLDRAAPKRQQNWDWRAAANFICGGAGSGLLVFSTLATLVGYSMRVQVLVGLALVGLGLTCVWFEIGRPLRALNVFRHIASSWMTREATVAPFLFASGGLAIITDSPILYGITGLCALAFLYSQARILNADKGIPAWRHPRCRLLIVTTGLAEGLGLLLLFTPSAAAAPAPVGGAAILLLIAARWAVWKYYLAGLSGMVPEQARQILLTFDSRFTVLSHALPALLAAGVIGLNAAWGLAPVGFLVAAGGAVFKYVLIRRAAFTQGFSLPHLPVRGRGPSGPAVKPGWSQTS